MGGVCYCSLRLSQPSLDGVKAGAELGNKRDGVVAGSSEMGLRGYNKNKKLKLEGQ